MARKKIEPITSLGNEDNLTVQEMPDISKKNTIPRGPAATAAKNKYRDNNYDRMELALPKGMKACIKEIAKQQGYSSQNSYVMEAVKEKYQRDTGEELTW